MSRLGLGLRRMWRGLMHAAAGIFGVDWAFIGPAEASTWSTRAWAYGGGRIVMLTQDSAFAYLQWIAISDDEGETWQYIPSRPGVGAVVGMAYGAGLFVAVGGSGGAQRITSSPDGINWTDRTGGLSAEVFVRVKYVNGLFIAGTASKVYTSPDGVAWTPVLTGVGQFYDACYGGGVWAALVGATCRYSSDGESWSSTSLPVSSLRTIQYIAGKFVAVGGDGVVYTSTDAITWTVQSVPSHPGAAVSIDDSGVVNGRMFAFSFGSLLGNQILYSDDGVTWAWHQTARSRSIGPGGALSTPNALLVQVPSGNVAVQKINQAFAFSISQNRLRALSGIARIGDRLVASSSDPGTPNAAVRVVSDDKGKTWSPRPGLPADATAGSAVGVVSYVATDGAKLIGCMSAAATGHSTSGAVSTDQGDTWAPIPTFPPETAWRGMSYGMSKWVAAHASADDLGSFYTSPDGETWTKRGAGLGLAGYGIRALALYGSEFACLAFKTGEASYLVTSPDGETWSKYALPVIQDFSGLARNDDGVWLVTAALASPYIYTSPDKTNWTSRTGITGAEKNGGTFFFNGLFFMVDSAGVEGNYAVLSSPDGETWVRNLLPSRMTSAAYGTVFGKRLYLFGTVQAPIPLVTPP